VPFKQSASGVSYADLRIGDGSSPRAGQTVVVEWVGYTSGYQAKKIESTRETDTPFTFVVGRGEAIPAFEEAVLEMKQGGIRRIEIPGELEEKLAYSRDPSQR
jgi:FKBP-type peptidyl-prolyl cis-trans isomerase